MVAPPTGAFLLPGPVKMHARVIEAMAVPAMNHRGPEFKEALAEIRTLTQYAFGTHGPVAVLSGSGTAGLEAAVSGLLRKDDRVLNLVNGKFSERFHDLCQVFVTPTALTFDWGTAVDPATVAAALDSQEYRAVTLCWNETSPGLTNPTAEVAKVVKGHDALFLVDGITAVGGLENRMEAWGLDALVVGSQKCLAAPAGLSAVALSKRAYDSLHSETSFYVNLKAHIDALAKEDTPFTPAVHLQSGARDHRPVVDAQVAGRDEHRRPAVGRHPAHHLLQVSVAGDAAPEEDLSLVHVGHRSLRDLRQHREGDFLDRECEVLERRAVRAQGEGRGQHPAEGDVHALHAVRQRKEPRSFAGEFLEDGTAGKREPALAGELVEEIPDSDVERLPEDAIPASGEGDHLRVAAAHVEEDGILRVRDPAPDLKVSDAVVDAENRH